MSDVTVRPHSCATMVDIEARGGTRRERGAAIAAVARRPWRHPARRLELIHISYSETHGFLEATYARYRVVEA